jgi:hypothetical protein
MREFHGGGPVHKNGMEIVANCLIGIEMAPMPSGAGLRLSAQATFTTPGCSWPAASAAGN